MDGEEIRAYMTATQDSVSMAELNLGPERVSRPQDDLSLAVKYVR